MGGFCRKARGFRREGGRVSGKGEAIYVIVVNWNNAEDTIRCLDSLASVSFPGLRVMVVDNGSTDLSVERIRQRFSQYDILELNSNRGFGGGCNAGYEQARKDGAAYVVFLNNDTIVAPDFLNPLIAPLRERKDVAIAVPRIYFMTRPGRIWYAGGEVNLQTGWIAHRGIRERDGERFELPFDTGYASGCCLAMRTSDFRDAGGFDPAFPLYGEDVDLSLRIRKAGKKILYVPASKVWHRVSASGGGELDLSKLWRKNLAMLRLLLKYHAWTGIIIYILLAPVRFVRGLAAVRSFRQREPEERQ